MSAAQRSPDERRARVPLSVRAGQSHSKPLWAVPLLLTLKAS